MRVLVCGGRTYADRERVYAALDRLHGRTPIEAVIHGAARGADALAGAWARDRGVPEQPFPANWEDYPPALRRMAGPNRNARMLVEGRPDVVVAFPGGSGTGDMTRRAARAGVPVEVIE